MTGVKDSMPRPPRLLIVNVAPDRSSGEMVPATACGGQGLHACGQRRRRRDRCASRTTGTSRPRGVSHANPRCTSACLTISPFDELGVERPASSWSAWTVQNATRSLTLMSARSALALRARAGGEQAPSHRPTRAACTAPSRRATRACGGRSSRADRSTRLAGAGVVAGDAYALPHVVLRARGRRARAGDRRRMEIVRCGKPRRAWTRRQGAAVTAGTRSAGLGSPACATGSRVRTSATALRGGSSRRRCRPERLDALAGSPMTHRLVKTGTSAPSSKNGCEHGAVDRRGDLERRLVGLDFRDRLRLRTPTSPLRVIHRVMMHSSTVLPNCGSLNGVWPSTA